MDAARGRKGLLTQWMQALGAESLARALASEVWPFLLTCSGCLQQLIEVTSASSTLPVRFKNLSNSTQMEVACKSQKKVKLGWEFVFVQRTMVNERVLCSAWVRLSRLQERLPVPDLCVHVYIQGHRCTMYMCLCIQVCEGKHVCEDCIYVCLCVHTCMCGGMYVYSLYYMCTHMDVDMHVCTAYSTCVHICELTCT